MHYYENFWLSNHKPAEEFTSNVLWIHTLYPTYFHMYHRSGWDLSGRSQAMNVLTPQNRSAVVDSKKSQWSRGFSEWNSWCSLNIEPLVCWHLVEISASLIWSLNRAFYSFFEIITHLIWMSEGEGIISKSRPSYETHRGMKDYGVRIKVVM